MDILNGHIYAPSKERKNSRALCIREALNSVLV
jgi:hypothetical protein